MRADKAFTTSDGTSNDAKDVLNMEIAPGQENNYIFSGTDAPDEIFPVLKSAVTDFGVAGNKTIQYNTGNIISENNTLLAYPEGATKVAIAISGMPAGYLIDDAILSARTIIFNFNFGGLVKDGGTNLTPEGQLLWKNAIYMLAGLDKETNVQDIHKEDIQIIQKGNLIKVYFNQLQDAEVALYNVTGILVNVQFVSGKNAVIDISFQPKGVYILNVAGDRVNGSRKFVLR